MQTNSRSQDQQRVEPSVVIDFPPIVPIIGEPGDTIFEAFDSGLSSNSPGTFFDSGFIGDNPNVAITDDVDFVSFQLDEGDLVTIDIDAQIFGSTLDSGLRLFDSDGIEVASNDDSDGLDSFLDFIAPTSDTYFVGVSSFGNFAYDPFTEGSGFGGVSTGDYNISITIFPQGDDREPENGSFETGTFSGWQTIGDTSIETADFGITPSDGTFQALITNGFSDSGGSVVESDLEAFLDLTPGILDSLGNGDVTEGSAIKRTFSANAGDILTFEWSFLTNEFTPGGDFNDFAFFSLTPFTQELADTNAPLFFETLGNGFVQETGYQTVTLAISESGTFDLNFGVVDVGDNAVDSALLIDNIRVSSGEEEELDPFEPNDSISEAFDTGLNGDGSIILSAFIGDGEFGDTTGDYDFFSLSADAGDIITIETFADSLGTGLDTIVSLYDSAGNLLAEDDDGSFTSLDSFLSFEVDTDGDYYAMARGFGPSLPLDPFIPGTGDGVGSTGNYDVEISILDGGITPPPDSEFDIEVLFIDDTLTPTQQAVFEEAANRWEEIIIGDVPDVVVQGLGLVDDIVIDASAPFIDGSGSILGQAGPTVIRSFSFLPARGIMEFDSADLADLEAEGLLDDVILHEMGHVLGIGTIWEELDLLTNINGTNPRYVGAGATAEYQNIFGVNQSSIPVEAEFGPGTALSHWDEEVFGAELMTGFINLGENPLSRITAASLGDLGYEVNVDAADVYVPPTVGSESVESVGHILTMNHLERTVIAPIMGYDVAGLSPKFEVV